MLRKLLPFGTLLIFAAAMVIAPRGDAWADPWKNEAHQHECYRVPPGHQSGHHRWVPPGHRKKADRHRGHHDCDRDRWDRDRWDDDDCDRWDRDDRRYRDRRYQDTRDWRYSPRKHKRYDRDNEDYGLIIRKGPHGTTIDVEYRRRDW